MLLPFILPVLYSVFTVSFGVTMGSFFTGTTTCGVALFVFAVTTSAGFSFTAFFTGGIGAVAIIGLVISLDAGLVAAVGMALAFTDKAESSFFTFRYPIINGVPLATASPLILFHCFKVAKGNLL